MLPMPPSTAAVKALSPAENLGVVEADEDPAGAAEGGAEEERRRDHAADVHAHDGRHLAVLGHGADRPAERGALHELMEPHHHENREARHDEQEHGHVHAQYLEPPASREQEARHVDLHPRTLGEHDGVLEEDGRSDRADQGAEPGGAAGVERAVGEALEAGSDESGPDHGGQEEERQHPRRVKARGTGREQGGEHAPADVGPDHEDLAVGEIDHEEDAVHHRVAESDQPVDRAEGEAEHELLGQDAEEVVHGQLSPR
jgi:hypothetical protein